MNESIRQAAAKEIERAITADEIANTCYYRIIRQFTSERSTGSETNPPSAGLKEIDTAWLRLNRTARDLRKAYMKLYTSFL